MINRLTRTSPNMSSATPARVSCLFIVRHVTYKKEMLQVPSAILYLIDFLIDNRYLIESRCSNKLAYYLCTTRVLVTITLTVGIKWGCSNITSAACGPH